jgi:hypothetical protein
MPAVTIYLPPDLIDAARKQASERNRSLSAWIGGLVREATATEWPRELLDLLRHGSADLVEPDDPPPEDVETLR